MFINQNDLKLSKIQATTWKIGSGNRPNMVNGEKFDHYDHKYDKVFF